MTGQFYATLVFRDPHAGRMERAFDGETPACVLRRAFAAFREVCAVPGGERAFIAAGIPCRRGVLNLLISREASPFGPERTAVSALLNEYAEHGGRFNVPVSRKDFAQALRVPSAF